MEFRDGFGFVLYRRHAEAGSPLPAIFLKSVNRVVRLPDVILRHSSPYVVVLHLDLQHVHADLFQAAAQGLDVVIIIFLQQNARGDPHGRTRYFPDLHQLLQVGQDPLKIPRPPSFEPVGFFRAGVDADVHERGPLEYGG